MCLSCDIIKLKIVYQQALKTKLSIILLTSFALSKPDSKPYE